MDLKHHYLNLVRRWIWLLILAPLSASVTSYYVSNQQPTVYSSQVRLIVGPGVDSPNPDLNALRAGGQLMQTYTKLATTRPVLQTVIDDLGLSREPDELERAISVKADSETQILTIRAYDGNPERAVLVANALADTLIRLSPSGPESTENQLKAQMRAEMAKLEEFIAETESRIRQLEAELQAAAAAEPDPIAQSIIDSTQTRIKQLETELQAASDIETQRLILDQIALERNRLFDAQRIDREHQRLIIDQLTQERTRLVEAQRTLSVLHTGLQSTFTNQVKVIEPAVSATPIVTQLRLKVLVAAMSGLILALATVLIFEYFNDKLETTESLAQVAATPVLGSIAKHKALRGTGRDGLVVPALPQSPAAEDYRMLGTKLLFASDHRSLHSVLISGLEADDDVGEIAANLALTIAQTGKHVVLVDVDLRRPTLAHLFGINGRHGLVEMLTDPSRLPEFASVEWAPGLSILLTGEYSSTPFELLASPRMSDLVKQLESRADVVIIAAPPLLSFAESLILASRVDGVVLVAYRGKARRDTVRAAIGQLHSLGAHLIGTVLHRGRQVNLRLIPSLPRRSANDKPDPEQPRTRQIDDIKYVKGV